MMIKYDHVLTLEKVLKNPFCQKMYKDEKVKNHSENIFFVAYLLFEGLKRHQDREFGPYIDLFP